MKLVEIKDVRVGQIRKNFDDIILIDAKKPDGFSHYQAFTEFGGFMNKDIKLNHKFLDMPIIGKLGITHCIEDSRLVEMPPIFKKQKINIDDIVKVLKDGSGPWVVDTTYNNQKYTHYISILSYHDCDFSEDEVEKIGILGVTHEFVNDREA